MKFCWYAHLSIDPVINCHIVLIDLDTNLNTALHLQVQPVLTIEPGDGYIYSATWSPVKATVLAATTHAGHLLIYDLKQGKTIPLLKIQASPQKQPVYTCQFNTQQ